MTTPEQIIAKIEEIEVLLQDDNIDLDVKSNLLRALNRFKGIALREFNLPTADPPEGSPGQEDMKN